MMSKPRTWSRAELGGIVDARVVSLAQVARAIRETGERLGLIGGDVFARHVPQVGDLLREHYVVAFCLELPREMLRYQRPLCQRLVRNYLATATQVEAEHE